MMYYGNQSSPGAHFPFNFMFIGTFDRQSNAPKVHNIIKSWIKGMPRGMWPNWVVSKIYMKIKQETDKLKADNIIGT